MCKFSLTPEGPAGALLCCVEDVASTGWKIFIKENISFPPKGYLIESGLWLLNLWILSKQNKMFQKHCLSCQLKRLAYIQSGFNSKLNHRELLPRRKTPLEFSWKRYLWCKRPQGKVSGENIIKCHTVARTAGKKNNSTWKMTKYEGLVKIFLCLWKKWTTVDCMFNQLASVSKFCIS